MLFNIIFLALGAAAIALPEKADCPRIRCIDGVNKCGIKYGRCYDMCTHSQPSPPPCPEITSAPTTLPPVTSTASPCTSTGTVCVDYLRSCGSPPTAILTYGGCYPACGPTPTFSPPPCLEPTETSAA
ncbi:uncharacterized protein F4817DRAFT_316501 [Daldinia loculata]|uniref:uncharacterized protein n=1 Tax=Daldinia loculata TaxID=103429 RepID=UPI0020C40D19|nr:uncharacterized protein F4817DRAFT_316501 [Daldinia loculata]KAI1646783.1 hypothetical protein F4817DRAFT_316501 [Daldinia loculata]